MIDAQSFLGPDASEIFGERTRPRVQRLTPRQPQPGAPPRSTQNITSFNKNLSTGNPPSQTVTICSINDYVDPADSQTIRFAPKVGRINHYSSMGCEKIKPNKGEYSDFCTPGGTPVFHPSSLTASCPKPLSPNAISNLPFKINPSKLPYFTPKNTRFFAMRCSVEPVARLLLATASPVNSRQAPSSPVKGVYE